jgi:Lrp/AsnC family transcriptional regulator for asnA, asnC and gidA
VKAGRADAKPVVPARTKKTPRILYDAVDQRIIGILQKDGRTSNTTIARELGIAEATVRRRIERLTKSGSVRITAIPEPSLAGLGVSAIIGFSCELSYVDSVAEALAKRPETRYLGYSTGEFDLVIEAFFRTHQHLLDFLTKQLSTIPGITRTETSIILKVAKFSFEWEMPTAVPAETA